MLAVLDPGKEDDLKTLFGPGRRRRLSLARGGLTARSTSSSIGGGMASGASCASELRKRGAERLDPAGRPRARAALRTAAALKEYLRGEGWREDAYVNEPSWYEENEVELLTGKNVMSIDAAAKTAKIQGGEEVAFGQALLGDGLERQHPARRGRRERGHPLPARLRQRRRDP